ncbi:FitA-like ribbon-helix-helix domain-containing protein [Membranihabitans maritimus]|uniref:FitA-like ribbon-helix-helix domain-containing protein n=1 Tax=Membranihabitans maritimus TaxID=2904244 RepID=UPI001F1A78D9|nr:hypothetical protein [Membranihabitans maritimus]
MPTLQIRNMPQEVYDLLQQSAKESRRSLTQEAIVLLEKVLSGTDIETAKTQRLEILDEIAKNRKLSKSDANLAIKWIREDRDNR